jgi:hypothetical protein
MGMPFCLKQAVPVPTFSILRKIQISILCPRHHGPLCFDYGFDLFDGFVFRESSRFGNYDMIACSS